MSDPRRQLYERWGLWRYSWWSLWVKLGVMAIKGRQCYSGPRWWWFVACKRIASGWWGV